MKKNELKMAAWLLSMSLMGFTITGCTAGKQTTSSQSTVSTQQTRSSEAESTKTAEAQTTSSVNRDLKSIIRRKILIQAGISQTRL